MTMPPPPPWDPPPPAPSWEPPPPATWSGPPPPGGWAVPPVLPGPPDTASDIDRHAVKRMAMWSLIVGGILGCVLAAIPGIVAYQAAQKVGPAQARGDGATARALAARARTWSIVGFVVGGLAFLPMVLFWIAVYAPAGQGS